MFAGFCNPGEMIPLPTHCEVCGVNNGDDHKKDCNYLSVLRASAYPEVLDDNGLPWYINTIRKLEQEIAELKSSRDSENK